MHGVRRERTEPALLHLPPPSSAPISPPRGRSAREILMMEMEENERRRLAAAAGHQGTAEQLQEGAESGDVTPENTDILVASTGGSATLLSAAAAATAPASPRRSRSVSHQPAPSTSTSSSTSSSFFSPSSSPSSSSRRLTPINLNFLDERTMAKTGGAAEAAGGPAFVLAIHSPASLRDQCLHVVVTYTTLTRSSPSASPVMMRKASDPTQRLSQRRADGEAPAQGSYSSTLPFAAAASGLAAMPSPSPYILTPSSFAFLDSVSTVQSSSLPVALVRDLEEVRRLLLSSMSSSGPAASPASSLFSSPSRNSQRIVPSSPISTPASPRRSSTFATIPASFAPGKGIQLSTTPDSPYSSSPPTIPMSLRQQESSSAPLTVGIMQPPSMLMPVRRRKTELTFKVVVVSAFLRSKVVITNTQFWITFRLGMTVQERLLSVTCGRWASANHLLCASVLWEVSRSQLLASDDGH